MNKQVTSQWASGRTDNAPKNIPLNQPAQQGAAVEPSTNPGAGAEPQKLLKVLGDVANGVNKHNATALQDQLEQLASDAENKQIAQQLMQLAQLLPMSMGEMPLSDPKLDPRAMARNIMNQVRPMIESNKKVYMFRASAKEQPKKKKKKTRGNPFRVLMGKVGKLLDHGIDKRTIVRHLLKENMFDEPMIDKAVDIVKEYNRKKHTKDSVHTEEHSFEPAPPSPGSKGKLMDHAPLMPAMPVMAGKKVYMNRTAEDSVYDGNIEWAKRSTAELFARGQWLNSLMKFSDNDTHNEGRKAADTKGASGELKSIKAELKRRGFDDAELEDI